MKKVISLLFCVAILISLMAPLFLENVISAANDQKELSEDNDYEGIYPFSINLDK